MGALGLLPFVSFAPKNAEAWMASTFFAVTLYLAGLWRLEATRASVLDMWGERFSLLGYLWAGLVLAGMTIAGHLTLSELEQRPGIR